MKHADNSRIPLVTLTFTALMVVLSNLWFIEGLCVPFSTSCAPDWRTLSGFSELVVWLFVGPFVHLAFGDLIGDLPFFVFMSLLVEVWMVRIHRRIRYYILLTAYGFSMLLNLFQYRVGGSEAGSSVLVFALVPVAWYYLLKFHDETSRLWNSLILIGLTGVTLFLDLMVGYRASSFGYSLSLIPVYPSLVHLWGLDYGLVLVAGYLLLMRDGLKLEYDT